MKKTKKIALVTGGLRRVGAEISKHLLKSGWSVIATFSKNESSSYNFLSECEPLIAQDQFIKTAALDLMDSNATQNFIKEINSSGENIDLIINNACIFFNDNFQTARMDLVEKNLHINALSPMILMQEMANQSIENGLVINMLDHTIFRSLEDFFSYNLSKSMLAVLTEQAAFSLSPKIRVNGIALSPIMKGERQSDAHFEKSANSGLTEKTLISELLKTINFIIETPSMTGEIIYLDGGRKLQRRSKLGD